MSNARGLKICGECGSVNVAPVYPGYVTDTGYRRIFVPGRGEVYEHRFVMETTLGRPLEPGERVFRKNADKLDNRPENLEIRTHATAVRNHRERSARWRRENPEEHRRVQNRWASERRNAYLADKSCETCGAREDLHLHHRDPATRIDGGSLWRWSRERTNAELAKCAVLCAPCHRAHHNAIRLREAQERHPCGTWQSYGRGCRCSSCKQAHAAYYLERRRARRTAA